MIRVELDDVAARDVIGLLARGYAMARIELALPEKTASAPWLWGERNRETWTRAMSKRKASYRAALLSIMDELPDVRFPEWKPYKSPGNPKWIGVLYLSEKAKVAASEFAEEVMRLAGLENDNG